MLSPKIRMVDYACDGDIIFTLATSPERDDLMVELVRTYSNAYPNKYIVFHAQTHVSKDLFVNLIKMHTHRVVNEVNEPSQIGTGSTKIISITPGTKNLMSFAPKLKNDTCVLVILTDVHKIYDQPSCDLVKLLKIIRRTSNKYTFRFVGFTIPLQDKKFSIDYGDCRFISRIMCETFGAPVDNSFELLRNYGYHSYDQIRFSQYKLYENRHEEISRSGLLGLRPFEAFSCASRMIFDIQKQLIEEYEQGDFPQYTEIRRSTAGYLILEPLVFLETYSNVLKVYMEYGEICALLAVDLYTVELTRYYEMLDDVSHVAYRRFISKYISALTAFRNAIYLYLPDDIITKLKTDQVLTSNEYLSLSSARLNSLIEEYAISLREHCKKSGYPFKVIVYVDNPVYARVLVPWMDGFSKAIERETPDNQLSSTCSFYYISTEDEIKIESKFIQDLYFYRNRKLMYKQYNMRIDKKNNFLFTTNLNEYEDGYPFCHLIVGLSSCNNMPNFLRLKRFVDNPRTQFLLIVDENECTHEYNDLTFQEAFYYNQESKPRLVHRPIFDRLAEFPKKIDAKRMGSIAESKEPLTSSTSASSTTFYNTFPKEIPRFEGPFLVSNHPFKCCHIYEVVFGDPDLKQLADELTDNKKSSKMLEETLFEREDMKSQSLCLIVPQDLPKLLDFNITHQYDDFVVEIRKLPFKINLSAKEVRTLLHFNRYVYTKIFGLDCEFDPAGVESVKLVIAPIDIKNQCLKFGLMEDIIDREYVLFHEDESFDFDVYNDAIICSDAQPERFYKVCRIAMEADPRTRLPSKRIVPTFAHYYRYFFNREISTHDQPLLEVLKLSKDLNLHKPLKATPIMVIPEFYRVWTMPYSLWMKISVFPAILEIFSAQLNIYYFNSKVLTRITSSLQRETAEYSLELSFPEKVVQKSRKDLQKIFDNVSRLTSQLDCPDFNHVDKEYDDVLDVPKPCQINECDYGDVVVEEETVDVNDLIDNQPLYLEAKDDKTAKSYKRMAAFIDVLKLELLYPQDSFEYAIHVSHECKLNNQIVRQNIVTTYNKILKQVYSDEIFDLKRIIDKIPQDKKINFTPKDNRQKSDEKNDFKDIDYLRELQMSPESRNTNEILRDCIHYFDDFYQNTKLSNNPKHHENNDGSYVGQNAREAYAHIPVQDLNEDILSDYTDFAKIFTAVPNPVQPPLGELASITTLAYHNDFENIKLYSLIGKTFIRFVLLNAYLTQLSNPETKFILVTEQVRKILDDAYFERTCAKIAERAGFGGLIGLEFNDDFWCPPMYTRNFEIERNGLKFNPTIDVVISNSALAESIQAYVGLYHHCAGATIAMEVMFALGFDSIIKFDASKYRNHQWKISNFPPNLFKFEDNDLLQDFVTEFQIEKIQEIFNYRFKNQELLFNSTIHPSLLYSEMKFFSNIGKIVLDFILSTAATDFPTDRILSTDYYLLSSHEYCLYTVQNQFYKYIAFKSPKIFQKINYFLREFFAENQDIHVSTLFDSTEISEKDLVEIPKVLSMSFQAIFGAIYVDSDFSLQSVYKCFSPFLRKKMDALDSMRHFNPSKDLEFYAHIIMNITPIQTYDGYLILDQEVFGGGRLEVKTRCESLGREVSAKKLLRYFAHQNQRKDQNRIRDQGYRFLDE